MTNFTKTLKNYISQVINSEFDDIHTNEVSLKFQKTCIRKSRGDMYFHITPQYVYVARELSKIECDYKEVINKHISEMTKEDWRIFYKEANKMNRRTKIKDFRYRTWLTDFIWINKKKFEI